MVITVEPGCYFNPFLLGPAFESTSQGPFLNKRRLEGSMVGLAYAVAEPVALAEQRVKHDILQELLPCKA